MCGLSLLALTVIEGYQGYVLFVWIYGVFCGGYHYSLKMFTFEKVRARNFPRAWGFVQCSQAIPVAIGVPFSGRHYKGLALLVQCWITNWLDFDFCFQ
jgi:hypothetical protein